MHTIIWNNSQEQRIHYNLRRIKWKPRIGAIEMLKPHLLSKATDQFAVKLAPRYVRPYTVNNYVSPVIVTLNDDRTNSTADTTLVFILSIVFFYLPEVTIIPLRLLCVGNLLI